MPYAVRIWFGKSPPLDTAAAGKLAAAHPVTGVPVRVGVPPACDALALCPTSSRRPAIVSTLPFRPDGSFGVLTGSATEPSGPAYTFHLVPNSFCALRMLIVALARRCV